MFRFLFGCVMSMLVLQAGAQTGCSVTIKNEDVMINGEKSGILKNKTYNKYTIVYDFTGTDGKKLSQFSISGMEKQMTVYVVFPSLNCSYNFHQREMVSPEFIITQWCSNGILSGNNLSKEALKTWCAKNKIDLEDRGEGKAKTDQSANSAPTIQVKNNAKTMIRARLIIQTKYGSSGITLSFHSSSVTPVSAKAGDELCIMDDSNKTVSCITIKTGIKNISINQSGTFFEEK